MYTNYSIEKAHIKPISDVLDEFRQQVKKAKEEGNPASLKNLTMTIKDNSFDVYTILKNRFMKQL